MHMYSVDTEAEVIAYQAEGTQDAAPESEDFPLWMVEGMHEPTAEG